MRNFWHKVSFSEGNFEIERLLLGLTSGLILTNNIEEEVEKNGISIKIMPVWKWCLG